jgi:hypothetical protein
MNDYAYADSSGDDDELELFADGPMQAGEEGAGDEEGMAWELLSVQSDAELEAFLGRLFRSAKRAATPMLGKLLRNGAKSLIRRALPALGGAAGSFLFPGAGAALGSSAGTAMSQLLGNEAAQLAEPDAELEVARRLVRTISDAAGRVAGQVAGQVAAGANPRAAVTGAFRAAMQHHVPALLGPPRAAATESGRWIRRGATIVLLGV